MYLQLGRVAWVLEEEIYHCLVFEGWDSQSTAGAVKFGGDRLGWVWQVDLVCRWLEQP